MRFVASGRTVKQIESYDPRCARQRSPEGQSDDRHIERDGADTVAPNCAVHLKLIAAARKTTAKARDILSGVDDSPVQTGWRRPDPDRTGACWPG